MVNLKVHNTLGRKLEDFSPIKGKNVGLYTCGLTVNGPAHIGNLRAYVFTDILKRTLTYFAYTVKHVMNITDVGHLSDDADSGDDKVELLAKKESMDAWAIAKKYTDLFLTDLKALHIIPSDTLCKATDHIKEQISLVKELEDKGYTYQTEDGIYFDTSKLEDYGALAQLDIAGLEEGKRIDAGRKKNKTDFALWKFSPKEEQRQMEWDSPWGVGFPGWHIECSAMSMHYLGEQFDIHTGGIDHIPIHHTNEIAQSESATGKKPFVKYWMHNEFLVMSDKKMSKSKGGTLTLAHLNEQDIPALALRYLYLNGHYRKQIHYSDKAIEQAKQSYNRLREVILQLKEEGVKEEKIKEHDYINTFEEAMAHDLNTPEALAVLWTVLRDQKLSAQEKYSLALHFDTILGLGIKDMQEETIEVSEDIKKLVEERETKRKEKNWEAADKIRDTLLEQGYAIIDTEKGPKVVRNA